jgi:hypothetical protein
VCDPKKPLLGRAGANKAIGTFRVRSLSIQSQGSQHPRRMAQTGGRRALQGLPEKARWDGGPALRRTNCLLKPDQTSP